MSRIFRPRTLVFALILVILAALTFGFAAANTVNSSKVGFGEGSVSGYTVDVSWALNSANPANATRADLDFNSDSPGYVYALVGTEAAGNCAGTIDWSGSWITCDHTADPATCPYTGAVLTICGIRVSAGD